MKKHQFKPFDQVLVRDGDPCIWKVGIYSHYEKESAMPYICVGSQYTQCIPYNENTAHLLGTCESYKEPEPKVWHVVNIKNGEPYEFTHNEFEHFIKTAVINNKDITNFHVMYIPNN